MKKPSFEKIALTILVVGGALGLYHFRSTAPEEERYIDYCGDSVYKRPGAVQQEGVTGNNGYGTTDSAATLRASG